MLILLHTGPSERFVLLLFVGELLPPFILKRLRQSCCLTWRRVCESLSEAAALSCKPIIFSREQMSIYVRVKELWAFGVAHKLAVIIMILALLAAWLAGCDRGSAGSTS